MVCRHLRNAAERLARGGTRVVEESALRKRMEDCEGCRLSLEARDPSMFRRPFVASFPG